MSDPEADDQDSGGAVTALIALLPERLAGSRCDRAAAQLFDQFSRARLKGWIESGRLTVDGNRLRPRDAVAGGARFELLPEADATQRWTPQAIPLQVLHADTDVIVLDKPAGLVTHPGAGVPDGTLANALLAAYPELERLPRAGIVHRLDKDTSGVMMVARSLEGHTALVRDLQRRVVHRRYLALCEGVPTGGFTVSAAIGRDPARRTRMAVVTSGGRPAVTHVRLLERFPAHAALQVELETGRTHQIRVHLAQRGHPLVGDTLYGARRLLPRAPDDGLRTLLQRFPRQALHAVRLEFRHPGTGAEVAFTAPLPEDITALLAALRRHSQELVR